MAWIHAIGTQCQYAPAGRGPWIVRSAVAGDALGPPPRHAPLQRALEADPVQETFPGMSTDTPAESPAESPANEVGVARGPSHAAGVASGQGATAAEWCGDRRLLRQPNLPPSPIAKNSVHSVRRISPQSHQVDSVGEST